MPSVVKRLRGIFLVRNNKFSLKRLWNGFAAEDIRKRLGIAILGHRYQQRRNLITLDIYWTLASHSPEIIFYVDGGHSDAFGASRDGLTTQGQFLSCEGSM